MRILNKIIEYGLYALVLALPLQTRWIIKAGVLNGGYSEYATISLYFTDILLIIILFLFIIWQISKQILNFKSQIDSELKTQNSKLKIGWIWWLIAGLELMVFISIFTAPDKIVAIYNYGRFLLGVGLFWMIINANYNKLKLFYFLLAGIFFQAVLGVWQFLTQSSFANKWLGMAVHQAGDLGTSVVETLSQERWLRAYGGLDHPNILGGMLVFGILILIGITIRISNFQFPSNFKIQKFFKLLTSYFLLLTFIVALFFTFSRGAWVGLIVGVLGMWAASFFKRDYVTQKKLLINILFLGTMVFILFNTYQDLITTRFTAETRLEKKSSIERLATYDQSMKIIKNNIFFGAGIGNYTKTLSKIEPNQESYYYQPVHNVFLLILGETGVFGLMFFISFIFYSFYISIGRINKTSYLEFSLLISVLITFLFDHWWWSLHVGVLYFWLIFGLILKRKKRRVIS